MKVEYVESLSGNGIDLIISISEFKKAAISKIERDMLDFIIFSFTRSQNINFAFPYDDIIEKLPKSGNVVFVIKESAARRYNPPRWCEIYLISNNITKPIYVSYDEGRNYILNTAVD